MTETLLSAGIDIGTTTTQVVFSRLTLENTAGAFSVPRVEIVDKTLVFRGGIHFTPLVHDEEIDLPGVKRILEAEYRAAGVDKAAVRTGAVVITGESAGKRNAAGVIKELSGFAGDFVVATAGPDLESALAARGAGADAYSRESGCAAANYDIGGGTSNFALFTGGRLASTGCLDIGGRRVRVEGGRVTYLAPKTLDLCRSYGIPLREGAPAGARDLEALAGAMTEILEMSLGLREKTALYPRLLTTPGRDIALSAPIGALSFSGGVAEAVYGAEGDDPLRYGDLGVLLGRAVRDSPLLARIRRIPPRETIRATVAGAGSHLTQVSGSTIEYDAAPLPLKNLPVIKLDAAPASQSPDEALPAAIARGLEVSGGGGAALAFAPGRDAGFKALCSLADSIAEGSKALVAKGLPLVAVSGDDQAKALGQALRLRLPAGTPIVSIDGVAVENGDYIDIGRPAAGGSVLPVAVKTLIFG